MNRASLVLSSFFVLCFSTISSGSEINESIECHQGDPNCAPLTTLVNFSIDCIYNNPFAPAPIRNCEVKSTFSRLVTVGGGEVRDAPPTGLPLTFSIECNGVPLTALNGVRFTNLLETQIVATSTSNSFPFIEIPRGEFHTGSHTSSSIMKILFNLNVIKSNGTCYISTV